MKEKKKNIKWLCTALLTAVLACGQPVADQNIQVPFTVASVSAANVQLNTKKVTLWNGGTTRLTLKGVNKNIKWSSSNKNVAQVSSKGVVKARKKGTATITATYNKKKYTCKVTVKEMANPDGASWKVSGNKVTVTGKGWSRTYTNYNQMTKEEFYPRYGCVVTAVATAASGYGSAYSHKNIHTGAASKKYSERYAVKKLGQSTALYGKAAIALPTASQILKDLGIANKPVYTFDPDQAIAEITANLMAGKPVIVHANNRRHDGIKIANSHHGVVLVGIDKEGYAIMLEPVGGRVNYAHGCGKKCRLTVEDIVRYHINQTAENKLGAAYVTSPSAFGGYILLQ